MSSIDQIIAALQKVMLEVNSYLLETYDNKSKTSSSHLQAQKILVAELQKIGVLPEDAYETLQTALFEGRTDIEHLIGILEFCL